MRLNLWIALYVSLLTTASTLRNRRAKRSLAFATGTKFFLRMNFKDLVASSSPYFFHAAGFKVTWDIPPGQPFRSKRSVQSLHDNLEFLYDRHGFDGSSCLARNICDAVNYVSRKNGVMAKIMRILANHSVAGNDTSLQRSLDCEYYGTLCPLEFSDYDLISG